MSTSSSENTNQNSKPATAAHLIAHSNLISAHLQPAPNEPVKTLQAIPLSANAKGIFALPSPAKGPVVATHSGLIVQGENQQFYLLLKPLSKNKVRLRYPNGLEEEYDVVPAADAATQVNSFALADSTTADTAADVSPATTPATANEAKAHTTPAAMPLIVGVAGLAAVGGIVALASGSKNKNKKNPTQAEDAAKEAAIKAAEEKRQLKAKLGNHLEEGNTEAINEQIKQSANDPEKLATIVETLAETLAETSAETETSAEKLAAIGEVMTGNKQTLSSADILKILPNEAAKERVLNAMRTQNLSAELEQLNKLMEQINQGNVAEKQMAEMLLMAAPMLAADAAADDVNADVNADADVSNPAAKAETTSFSAEQIKTLAQIYLFLKIENKFEEINQAQLNEKLSALGFNEEQKNQAWKIVNQLQGQNVFTSEQQQQIVEKNKAIEEKINVLNESVKYAEFLKAILEANNDQADGVLADPQFETNSGLENLFKANHGLLAENLAAAKKILLSASKYFLDANTTIDQLIQFVETYSDSAERLQIIKDVLSDTKYWLYVSTLATEKKAQLVGEGKLFSQAEADVLDGKKDEEEVNPSDIISNIKTLSEAAAYLLKLNQQAKTQTDNEAGNTDTAINHDTVAAALIEIFNAEALANQLTSQAGKPLNDMQIAFWQAITQLTFSQMSAAHSAAIKQILTGDGKFAAIFAAYLIQAENLENVVGEGKTLSTAEAGQIIFKVLADDSQLKLAGLKENSPLMVIIISYLKEKASTLLSLSNEQQQAIWSAITNNQNKIQIWQQLDEEQKRGLTEKGIIDPNPITPEEAELKQFQSLNSKDEIIKFLNDYASNQKTPSNELLAAIINRLAKDDGKGIWEETYKTTKNFFIGKGIKDINLAEWEALNQEGATGDEDKKNKKVALAKLLEEYAANADNLSDALIQAINQAISQKSGRSLILGYSEAWQAWNSLQVSYKNKLIEAAGITDPNVENFNDVNIVPLQMFLIRYFNNKKYLSNALVNAINNKIANDEGKKIWDDLQASFKNELINAGIIDPNLKPLDEAKTKDDIQKALAGYAASAAKLSTALKDAINSKIVDSNGKAAWDSLSVKNKNKLIAAGIKDPNAVELEEVLASIKESKGAVSTEQLKKIADNPLANDEKYKEGIQIALEKNQYFAAAFLKLNTENQQTFYGENKFFSEDEIALMIAEYIANQPNKVGLNKIPEDLKEKVQAYYTLKVQAEISLYAAILKFLPEKADEKSGIETKLNTLFKNIKTHGLFSKKILENVFKSLDKGIEGEINEQLVEQVSAIILTLAKSVFGSSEDVFKAVGAIIEHYLELVPKERFQKLYDKFKETIEKSIADLNTEIQQENAPNNQEDRSKDEPEIKFSKEGKEFAVKLLEAISKASQAIFKKFIELKDSSKSLDKVLKETVIEAFDQFKKVFDKFFGNDAQTQTQTQIQGKADFLKFLQENFESILTEWINRLLPVNNLVQESEDEQQLKNNQTNQNDFNQISQENNDENVVLTELFSVVKEALTLFSDFFLFHIHEIKIVDVIKNPEEELNKLIDKIKNSINANNEKDSFTIKNLLKTMEGVISLFEDKKIIKKVFEELKIGFENFVNLFKEIDENIFSKAIPLSPKAAKILIDQIKSEDNYKRFFGEDKLFKVDDIPKIIAAAILGSDEEFDFEKSQIWEIYTKDQGQGQGQGQDQEKEKVKLEYSKMLIDELVSILKFPILDEAKLKKTLKNFVVNFEYFTSSDIELKSGEQSHQLTSNDEKDPDSIQGKLLFLQAILIDNPQAAAAFIKIITKENFKKFFGDQSLLSNDDAVEVFNSAMLGLDLNQVKELENKINEFFNSEDQKNKIKTAYSEKIIIELSKITGIDQLEIDELCLAYKSKLKTLLTNFETFADYFIKTVKNKKDTNAGKNEVGDWETTLKAINKNPELAKILKDIVENDGNLKAALVGEDENKIFGMEKVISQKIETDVSAALPPTIPKSSDDLNGIASNY